MQQENGGESCVASSQKTDEFAVSRIFLFVFYRRSRVFLWVASEDIACLSVDDANGAL